MVLYCPPEILSSAWVLSVLSLIICIPTFNQSKKKTDGHKVGLTINVQSDVQKNLDCNEPPYSTLFISEAAIALIYLQQNWLVIIIFHAIISRMPCLPHTAKWN